MLPFEYKNIYKEDDIKRNYSSTNIRKNTDIFCNDDKENNPCKLNYKD